MSVGAQVVFIVVWGVVPELWLAKYQLFVVSWQYRIIAAYCCRVEVGLVGV